VFAALTVALAAGSCAADETSLRLNGHIDGKSKTTIEVVGLDADTLAALAKAKMDREHWTALFAVRVVGADADDKAPPLLGSYRIENELLRFEPRFPLAQGVRYRAVFELSRLPGRKDGKAVTADFHQPKPTPKATTVIRQAYPTRNKLPENQLKFYLHFSAPMGKGGSYRHIQLLAADGKPIEQPFLELEQELWDRDGKRFTLFIDPGRIKRGLKPREEVGPVLEEGKSYTLVIDRNWTDAEDNPLQHSFRKLFTVGPPDDKPIEPKEWKLAPPAAQTRLALVVRFPKPLDHALLQRLVWVVDAKGTNVSGTIDVAEGETLWRFTPDGPWTAGAYDLVIDKALEDLAGNNVGRPFEVDVFGPVQSEIKQETVNLPFRIKDTKEFKPRRPDR
jgi:hypothetical protein